MLLISLGRIAQFILMLITMRVATAFLPPPEMGRMSLITAATAFFALFFVNPVGMFINRYLHSWELSGKIKTYLGYYWFYLLLVSFVAAMCLIIANHIGIIRFQIDTAWLLILVCGSLFFNTANQTVIPSLNLLGFRGWFIVLTLATVCVSFIFALYLILSFQPKAEYWLLGLLSGQIILAGIGHKIFIGKLRFECSKQKFRKKLTKEQIKMLFIFASPVAISVGLNWVQTQGYRFFIENSLGLAQLGLFVAGYGISMGLVAAFESVLTTYLQPEFYKMVSSGNKEEQTLAWNNYAGAIFPAMTLLVIFVAAMAPELASLFLGPAYQTASQFVVWGALAESMRAIGNVYGLVAHARVRTYLLILPNLAGAMTVLALVGLLVPKYGIQGLGIALVMAGFIVVFVMHALMGSVLKIILPRIPLFRSIGMGGIIILIVSIARYLFKDNDSIFSTLILLSTSGVFFLSMEYFLLRPFINSVAEVI